MLRSLSFSSFTVFPRIIRMHIQTIRTAIEREFTNFDQLLEAMIDLRHLCVLFHLEHHCHAFKCNIKMRYSLFHYAKPLFVVDKDHITLLSENRSPFELV